jgi:hypothetical protein
MSGLPPIEFILMQPSYSVDIRNPEAYHGEFLKEFAENISADSWALTVDDEIIFNEYVEKSIKERIMEGVLRNRIADEPHQLFWTCSEEKWTALSLFICLVIAHGS